MAKPTVEQIRQRAQEIWIENHRPEGRDDEFWYQAEKELNEKELLLSPADFAAGKAAKSSRILSNTPMYTAGVERGERAKGD